MSVDEETRVRTERRIPQTGEGWIDAPLPDAVNDALVRKIGEQQRRIAATSRSGLEGKIDRGQHQKMLIGARGRLRIFDDVPTPVKTGPLSAPLTFHVASRFSNGQPCPFPDSAPDVRGVAIKFFLPTGDEVDLLATNEGGRSHAVEAESFMAFADVLVSKIENGSIGALRELISQLRSGGLGVGEAARIALILGKEVGLRKVGSLATESYWGSVVKLGSAAFKYSLHPHQDAGPSTHVRTGVPNFLREELLARLAKGPVKWQLAVQLFIDEENTPVNDAARAWRSPLIPVGELEIASAPTDDDENAINQMAFNPANGFDALGITHARKEVYAASARNRSDRGLLSADEARRFLLS